MSYLGDAMFKQDFSIYVLILFVIIGFFVGFFFKINSKKGKTHVLKMEKDADVNQSRINALKEKIEELEKENRALGGTSSFP